MANPFQDNQDTTGGKAGFAAFKELQTDKAYDDETLKPNPGAPLPAPAGAVPEFTDYAFMLILMVVVGGFFVIRRQEELQ